MTTPRHIRTHFASWLDAFVAGTSTPVNRKEPDSAFADLQRAATQIHDLNRSASEIMPDLSPVPSWETFMSSSPTIHIVPSTPSAAKPPFTFDPRAASRWLRIDRAASLLLAAVLLLSITAGIWQASGGFISSNDSPPPTDPTKANLGLVQATPDSEQPVDLPTAADCTVEPLTVDEVLWYVTSPQAALTNLPHANQSLSSLQQIEPKYIEMSASDVKGSLATAEDIESASKTQRMWMACILAESYFQVWAVQDPYLVQSDVISRIPTLTGIDQTRSILEELKLNGAPIDVETATGFQLFADIKYPGGEGIQVINQDLDVAWKMSAFTMALSIDRYEIDGTYLNTSSIFRYPTTEPDFSIGSTSLSCDAYRFEWSEPRSMWLVSWAPSCG